MSLVVDINPTRTFSRSPPLGEVWSSLLDIMKSLTNIKFSPHKRTPLWGIRLKNATIVVHLQ